MADPIGQRGDANLAMLALVADRLGPLRDEVVFLGGCTTGLLISDMAAHDVRATRDVDLIVEVVSIHAYHELEGRMRALGFQPDVESGIRCRWRIDGMIVDLMPTDEAILGFSNAWYGDAIRHAVTDRLPNGQQIRRVTAPYFLATKIEAFLGRGEGDFMASHDLEDIVAVIDGRPELVDEVARADAALRRYLARQFRQWLHDRDFIDALSGHLPPDAVSQERLPLLMERIRTLAAQQD